MNAIVQDLRLASARLRAKPGHFLMVALILALGIGASTAIFTLVDATLFRRFDLPGGDRLVGAVFRTELDTLGLKTECVEGAAFERTRHLVATHPGQGPRILLIGHLDTVFEPDRHRVFVGPPRTARYSLRNHQTNQPRDSDDA